VTAIAGLGNGNDVFTISSAATGITGGVSADFTATSATLNNKNQAAGLLIVAAGIDVNMSAATGNFGYKIDGSTTGAHSIVGSSFADSLEGGAGTDTIIGGSGGDILLGAAAIDDLTAGEGADTVNPGAAADIVSLTETTAATDTFVMVDGDSTEAAMDVITGFAAVATNGDKLTNTTGAFDVSANASAIDVSAVAGAGATATTASGIVTLNAAGNTYADTVGKFIDVIQLAGATTVIADGDAVAFAFGSDMYVLDDSTGGDYSVIKLAGLTGVTAMSDTAAAANTIFIG
jgi:Ca2+-binding RTX toxin-like protein